MSWIVLDFINNKARLIFQWSNFFISERQLYTYVKHEKKVYNLFFDRDKQQTHLLTERILDDIDGGFDPFMII